MKHIFDLFLNILSNTRLMLAGLIAVSAFSLGMAFMAQYVFGLAPCILCLYQRVPFAIVIVLGLIGLVLSGKYPKTGPFFLVLSGLSLLTNSIIAFYHTGVEQKWWVSFLEACSTPDMSGNVEDLMARIQAAPVVRCDEIPWVDPILGLSMANYNVIFCLGLAIVAFIAARCIKQA